LPAEQPAASKATAIKLLKIFPQSWSFGMGSLLMTKIPAG
jgi:hypothetical protein